jgi:hypothetical protein
MPDYSHVTVVTARTVASTTLKTRPLYDRVQWMIAHRVLSTHPGQDSSSAIDSLATPSSEVNM